MSWEMRSLSRSKSEAKNCCLVTLTWILQRVDLNPEVDPSFFEFLLFVFLFRLKNQSKHLSKHGVHLSVFKVCVIPVFALKCHFFNCHSWDHSRMSFVGSCRSIIIPECHLLECVTSVITHAEYYFLIVSLSHHSRMSLVGICHVCHQSRRILLLDRLTQSSFQNVICWIVPALSSLQNDICWVLLLLSSLQNVICWTNTKQNVEVTTVKLFLPNLLFFCTDTDMSSLLLNLKRKICLLFPSHLFL